MSSDGHSHHPNYVLIFVWLVILTAIEVSIPEVIKIPSRGADPQIPTVSQVTRADGEDPNADERTKVAASMAPTDRFHKGGNATKIFALSFLAVVKAGLVGAFFMHLKFDGWKLCVIMATPTVLFGVIMVLTAPDIAIDWPALYPWGQTATP